MSLPDSLRLLAIHLCPGLNKLPPLPAGLTVLRIIGCPLLTKDGVEVGQLKIEIK